MGHDTSISFCDQLLNYGWLRDSVGVKVNRIVTTIACSNTSTFYIAYESKSSDIGVLCCQKRQRREMSSDHVFQMVMIRLDNESSSFDSLKYSVNGVSHEIMASKQLIIYLTFASFLCPFFSQFKARSMKSELPAIPSFSADCSILPMCLLFVNYVIHSVLIPFLHSCCPFCTIYLHIIVSYKLFDSMYIFLL